MGIEAVFSSAVGGAGLRARILALVAGATSLAGSHAVDLNVMMFSFTDPLIANSLAAAARQPRLNIRVIADWTQRAADGHHQVGRLGELGLPNLAVRYKKDQPYVWDAATAQLRWSYRVSRGLLHHKTLSVIVDGEPWQLICGSFNWTAKAAESYENLLIVTDSTAGSREVMSRVQLEFEALWSDGTASMSAGDAQAHYEAIAASYRGNNSAEPRFIDGLIRGRGDALRILNPHHYTSIDSVSHASQTEPILIAFSARRPHEGESCAGYAEFNRKRRMILCSPSGRMKRVPLTITALALDVVFRARPGETLLIAMHGLSIRVPEYGALLDAARRGVRLRILLDRKLGDRAVDSLSRVLQREQLPIDVKSGFRMMHQKYIVNEDSFAVFNGTANMTTDASGRHSEHRIRVLGSKALASQFVADFETIWSRVSAHYVKSSAEKE